MKSLILLTLLLLTTSGCVVGYGKADDVSFFYARIGDQKLVVKDGEINQSSDGKAPSGFLAMLAELFK